MNTNNILLLGFNLISNNTITINGVTMPCVFDNTGLGHEKNNTFQEDFESPIIVKTSDLPANLKSIIGKIATINGASYRVDRVRGGGATSFVFLNIKDKA